jgi:hypothetical protein
MYHAFPLKKPKPNAGSVNPCDWENDRASNEESPFASRQTNNNVRQPRRYNPTYYGYWQ